jgi:hypothetical protein
MQRPLSSVFSPHVLWSSSIASFLLAGLPCQALNNGLAVTPPMGWNSWNAFHCNSTIQHQLHLRHLHSARGLDAVCPKSTFGIDPAPVVLALKLLA